MFISLQTTENWVLEDSLHPAIFFSNLGIVLSDLDTLVIGSYEMDADSQDYFVNNTFEEKLFTKPYFDSFDSNRDEYPEGRAWAFRATKENFDGLAKLASRYSESNKAMLFFDHLLAYRAGEPLVPLFDYHDAFRGGKLRFSGLYSDAVINGIACGMGVGYSVEQNTEIFEEEN